MRMFRSYATHVKDQFNTVQMETVRLANSTIWKRLLLANPAKRPVGVVASWKLWSCHLIMNRNPMIIWLYRYWWFRGKRRYPTPLLKRDTIRKGQIYVFPLSYFRWQMLNMLQANISTFTAQWPGSWAACSTSLVYVINAWVFDGRTHTTKPPFDLGFAEISFD